MDSTQELKALMSQKKELLERQRELQAKANEGKEERKQMRKQQAQARKDIRALKTTVRTLNADIYRVFSEGTPDDILDLADELSRASEELCQHVRSFGEAAETLSKL